MKRIAIVGASSSDGSNVRLKQVLEGLEYTVSSFVQGSTSSLINFDMIITTRFMGSQNIPEIMSAFNLGVPVIVGMEQQPTTGVGPSAGHLGGVMGLCSETNFESTTNRVNITTATFPGYTKYQDVVVMPNTEIQSFCQNSKISPNAIIIANYTSKSETHSTIFAAKKGVTSLLGAPFPSSCAFAGFLYASNNNYTAAGIKLIGDLINYVFSLNSSAIISGHVLNENGEPIVAKLYLYDQLTGSLLGLTTSLEDGTYQFEVNENVNYFVVCTSDSEDQNFKINAYVQGLASGV